MGEERRSLRRPLMLLGCMAVAALIALALTVTAGVGRIHVPMAEGRMLAAWEEGLGPIDERFTAMYPARETNGDARELERLAASLGLDLVPRGERGSRRTAEVPDAGFPRKEVGSHLYAVLESPEHAPGAAPEAVREYLDRHREELDAVVRHLLESDPRWLMDTEKGPEAPIANLLGQIQLQKLLLVHALERDREGEGAASEDVLEASWRFNRRLGERPELISLLIHIAVLRMQAGALRHLRDPDPRWVERLDAAEPLEAMAFGMRGEAASMRGITMEHIWGVMQAEEGDFDWGLYLVDNPLTKTWVRWSVSDVLEAAAQYHREVLAKDVCDFDLDAIARRMQEGLSPLNLAIGPLLHTGDAWRRAKRLDVDLEATSRVLAFRSALADARARPRSQEALEAFVADHGLETGSVCAGAHWTYRTAGDPPAYVVRFEGPELWRSRSGTPLPLEHRIPVAPRR